MNDYRPGYFDYDDPRDYEEWCGWDDPVANGLCYNPYRLNITGLLPSLVR